MPIYDKPVRELLKEFVKDTALSKGGVISRQEVLSWFEKNYPKIKKPTINAHLLRMSTNASSRIHYSVKSNGEDDLFFQIDSSHFRLYNEEIDPLPIYRSGEDASTRDKETIDEDIDENAVETREFAYERDLRNFLSTNLAVIESGLRLYEEEGITGVEFPVGGRFIDILAIDKSGNLVVIELKVSKGYDRVVGQLLRYMAWIEKHLSDPHQSVRGIIIASNISEDLLLASSKLSDVELFEYELSLSLNRIK